MDRITDREHLVAALRQYGIDWLAPSDANGPPVSDTTLITSLATHHDARLRQALIGLFLLHPQLASLVPRMGTLLEDGARQELYAYYMAAVYLQTMWRFRLGHYLPEVLLLPDYFSQLLQLPACEDEYGKAGLYALAAWHASLTPWPYNYLSAYDGVAEMLFASLKMKRVHHEFSTSRGPATH